MWREWDWHGESAAVCPLRANSFDASALGARYLLVLGGLFSLEYIGVARVAGPASSCVSLTRGQIRWIFLAFVYKMRPAKDMALHTVHRLWPGAECAGCDATLTLHGTQSCSILRGR